MSSYLLKRPNNKKKTHTNSSNKKHKELLNTLPESRWRGNTITMTITQINNETKQVFSFTTAVLHFKFSLHANSCRRQHCLHVALGQGPDTARCLPPFHAPLFPPSPRPRVYKFTDTQSVTFQCTWRRSRILKNRNVDRKLLTSETNCNNYSETYFTVHYYEYFIRIVYFNLMMKKYEMVIAIKKKLKFV